MAFFISMAVLGLFAILLQMISPKLPFLEARPFLVAIPVLYAAMRMGGRGPFYLAIFLGSVIDILSPQKFGTEGFVLCLLAGMVWTQQESFPFDSVLSVLVLALVTSFLSLVVDYFFFSWQSGNWDWHFTMWVRMAWVAVLNMILAVPFFWVCDQILLRWMGDQCILRGGKVSDYAL